MTHIVVMKMRAKTAATTPTTQEHFRRCPALVIPGGVFRARAVDPSLKVRRRPLRPHLAEIVPRTTTLPSIRPTASEPYSCGGAPIGNGGGVENHVQVPALVVRLVMCQSHSSREPSGYVQVACDMPKPSDTATLPVRIRHTHLMSLRIGLVSATSHRVRRWRRYDHPGDQRRRRGRHCQSTSAGAVALLFHGMTSPPLTATLASMSLCSMRPNRFRLS